MNTTTPSVSEFVQPPEAAAILGVSRETLAVWRCLGRHNLPFTKSGGKVLYRRADLDAWLAMRTGTSGRQIQHQLQTA